MYFDFWYINFYTISMIQVFILYSFSALFLLLIPEKSKATLYLGLCFFFSIFVSLGYVLSQGFYYPNAFARVITLVAVPYHFLLYPQFLFRFPTFEKPKLARILLITQVVIASLTAIYVIYASATLDIFYSFKGHYYDYQFPKFLKVYGLITSIYVLIGVGTGIWKTVITKDNAKLSVFFITLGVIVATLFPALANVLNKAGIFDRDGYVIALSIFNLTGVFIILVAYINKTTDKTTFMFKIVGISFLVFMLIFNSLGFFIFQHRETTYDMLQHKDVKLAIETNTKLSKDIEYIYEYDPNSNRFDAYYNKQDYKLPKSSIKIDLIQYSVFHNLLSFSESFRSQRIYREVHNSHTKFVTYRYFDPQLGAVYEVAFSYRKYREFIHQVGKTLFYIFISGLLVIIFGTPLFLSGALLAPLKELLKGLRRVKKGKLDINIPVKVQDEIGFLTQSFNTMVKSIREAKEKLQDYSNHLEEKVEERTKELQNTLTQVESLKTQQDGDYFLTTLLLKPLGAQTANSDRVKINSFLKQKKEFMFKKKSLEIGGDICISQNLELRDRKYIVFLNADAMGKSIQGAGGILVLGSVFQSIIQRTQNYKYMSQISPEQWIKYAFKEMHKIFESFDGSMLISLIIGIVEESSGLVYYINAEHPWMVLYRDGVADFVYTEENSNHFFHKLGTPGMEKEIIVSIFEMAPGDTLIMGSDGKDDVVLEHLEGNIRMINEDEQLFLKRVEEAKGDLNQIYDVIKSKYELMDDLSLLSIEYLHTEEEDSIQENIQASKIIKRARKYYAKEDIAKAIELLEGAKISYPNNQQIPQDLIRIYMKLKNYERASILCKEYLSKDESDTSIMIKASYCLKMNNELDEAIEIAERVKLRDPYNTKNLALLADMYTYKQNYERANKLLQKLLKLEPDNKWGQIIHNKIKR